MYNLRTGPRNYQMRCDEIYAALGFDPKKHLPKEGFTGAMIGNVYVWVLPKTEQAQDAARTWCACPDCGKALTAGKLEQHRKVHRTIDVREG